MSGCGPTAQPSRTPGQKTFENVPAWSTTSGPSDHSDGRALAVEGQLAVGDVLEDQHAVAAADSTSAWRRSSVSVRPDGFWNSGMT